jgi:hypothetical protein
MITKFLATASPMHTFTTEAGGDDAPPRRRARVADHEGVGPPTHSLEDESVRELNRLLDAALRIGGEGGADASALLFDSANGGGGGPSSSSSAGGEDPPPGLSILNLSSAEAASWRLDTARRLSSVSSANLWGGNSLFSHFFLRVGIFTIYAVLIVCGG